MRSAEGGWAVEKWKGGAFLSLEGRGIELSVFYGESSKMLITLRQELGFITGSVGMTTTGGLLSPGIMFALHHLEASKYIFWFELCQLEDSN